MLLCWDNHNSSCLLLGFSYCRLDLQFKSEFELKHPNELCFCLKSVLILNKFMYKFMKNISN